MSSRPGVSVVVLSYDRPAMLAESLRAILAQQPAPLEVIVVDNASPRAAEVERVVHAAPGARYVQAGHNLGFAGGMNHGLGLAGGEFVLLTEDDIVLEPGCIAALAADALAHPDTGISSALMLNRAGGTIRCAGGEATLGEVFAQKISGWGERDIGQFASRAEVGFVPGAIMFARRDFLAGLGGFREEFFMYYEDLELCLRARKAGRSVVMVPAARASHFEPPAGEWSALLELHKVKNLAATYLLHAETRVLPRFVLRYGVFGLVRAVAEPRRIVPHLRACAWVLFNGRRLLRERGN